MRKLPLKLKLYLYSLYAATFFALLLFSQSKYMTIAVPDIPFVIVFVMLMALTESFSVNYRSMSFSTGFAVAIASFILKGPFVTIIVIVLGYSIRVLREEDEYIHFFNTPKFIILFNYCLLIIPVLIGTFLYRNYGGIYGDPQIAKHLLPISLYCLTTFFMNIILIGIFISIRNNEKSILFCIISNVKLSALNFIAMAPLGLLAAYMYYPNNYVGLILLIFPLILARFTLSLYIEAKSKYIQTVDVIMHAMEARDKYTEGHSRRVSDLSCMIAKELKFSEWKMEDLKMAALMHDAGKIGIDDQILNKPDKLTDEEYNMIKQHPEIGYNILKAIKDIEYVLKIVRYHHERYDGKGYPEGKYAAELPIDVFIVQLADSVDAMATDRPYRKAMTQEYIESELIRCKGTQFHPVVVDAYFKAIENNKQN